MSNAPTTIAAPAPRSEHITSDRGLLLTLALVGFLVGVRLLAVVSSLPAGERARVDLHAFSYDVARYHAIADAPGLPYRDSAVEFPPVSLGFLEVVDGPTVGDTMGRLGWASLVLDLAAAAALAYGFGRRSAIAYLVLGLPFFYLPFVYFRIDLLSVAMAAWAVALVRRERDAAGGAVLALAVFAKLWPLAVLPLLIVQRRWRALRVAVATGAGVALVWLAWSGTKGFEQVLTFRHATGWHIESVVGGALRLVTGAPDRLENDAVRVGSAPSWATALLALMLLAVVVDAWRTAARAPDDDGLRYGVAPIAAVGAFLVCSPLLSPQYLVWLVPFAAIAWAAGRHLLGVLVVVASTLTMVLTQHYNGLNNSTPGAQALLTARNGVLVGIVVVALVTLHREATQ